MSTLLTRNKVCDTDLRKGLEAHGVRLSRRETRRLIDSAAVGGSARSLNFRQFSAMLESSGGLGGVNTINAGGGRRRKGVTFRDGGGNGATSDDSDDDGSISGHRHRRRSRGGHHHVSGKALLRASLRRLTVPVKDEKTGPTAAAAASGSVGPGLRERLRGALRVAADARGARRGGVHVDRETVRRAMAACGTPLEPTLLGDLERRFDRRGTGEINVEVSARRGMGKGEREEEEEEEEEIRRFFRSLNEDCSVRTCLKEWSMPCMPCSPKRGLS